MKQNKGNAANTGTAVEDKESGKPGTLPSSSTDAAAADSVVTDPHRGHGGSYVVDEATQTRQPNK